MSTPEKNAYNRKWNREHPEVGRAATKRYKARNVDKRRAHEALHHAIEDGIIVRPDTCPCGKPRPEGHHSDYSKPLMVARMCRDCHRELHRSEKSV
jgi:hypothetical protein